MAVNHYRPHLIVLSEDDATRSLAVGFSDHINGPMEICRSSGGWPSVLQQFQQTYVPRMKKFGAVHLLMLIDFDGQFPSRLEHFRTHIPDEIADRVYILGAEDEAETLRREQSLHFGPLGAQLARECREQRNELWACPQLRHNQPELDRLIAAVRPFLF